MYLMFSRLKVNGITSPSHRREGVTVSSVRGCRLAHPGQAQCHGGWARVSRTEVRRKKTRELRVEVHFFRLPGAPVRARPLPVEPLDYALFMHGGTARNIRNHLDRQKVAKENNIRSLPCATNGQRLGWEPGTASRSTCWPKRTPRWVLDGCALRVSRLRPPAARTTGGFPGCESSVCASGDSASISRCATSALPLSSLPTVAPGLSSAHRWANSAISFSFYSYCQRYIKMNQSR